MTAFLCKNQQAGGEQQAGLFTGGGGLHQVGEDGAGWCELNGGGGGRHRLDLRPCSDEGEQVTVADVPEAVICQRGGGVRQRRNGTGRRWRTGEPMKGSAAGLSSMALQQITGRRGFTGVSDPIGGDGVVGGLLREPKMRAGVNRTGGRRRRRGGRSRRCDLTGESCGGNDDGGRDGVQCGGRRCCVREEQMEGEGVRRSGTAGRWLGAASMVAGRRG